MHNIAIFASHNGSFLDTIYTAVQNGELFFNISFIMTNNSGAKVLEKAKKYNIPAFVVNDKLYDETDKKLESLLTEYNCNTIVLSGYMKKLSPNLTQNFTFINSHPALLPKFGGRGMYGRFVHESVIEAKETKSGATIHYVNENYDEGAIILQKSLDVFPDDTPQMLETRVKELEQKMIIEVLKDL